MPEPTPRNPESARDRSGALTSNVESGWRGGSAAIAVLSFDVDAESAILARGAEYAAHAMVISHQAYGPLVGVPRILDLLADLQLRATFFVPGLTADRYPGVAEKIAVAGHEIAHHSYSHRPPVQLDPGEERLDFERGLAALERVGVRPRGTAPRAGRRAGKPPRWSPSTGCCTTQA